MFGIRFLIILGHVLTIIRVFAYTLLPKGPAGATIALGLHLLNGKRHFPFHHPWVLIFPPPLSLSLCHTGIAFSALWGAGVVQADELAPPSLQATSQGKTKPRRRIPMWLTPPLFLGILAAMYAGVGSGLGSLLGGVVYEKLGSTQMFYVVIGLTSFSLELYLETNTRWGLCDLTKWTVQAIVGTYRWIQRARGRQAVPRWSGARMTGPIHLRDDNGDDDDTL